jgi:hypothetical protein
MKTEGGGYMVWQAVQEADIIDLLKQGYCKAVEKAIYHYSTTPAASAYFVRSHKFLLIYGELTLVTIEALRLQDPNLHEEMESLRGHAKSMFCYEEVVKLLSKVQENDPEFAITIVCAGPDQLYPLTEYDRDYLRDLKILPWK